MDSRKEAVRDKTKRKMRWAYLKQGIILLRHSTKKRCICFAIILSYLSLNAILPELIPDNALTAFFIDLYRVAIFFVAVTGIVMCLLRWGTPENYVEVSDNLLRIGFVNSAGESPVLVAVNRVPNEPDMRELIFDSCGIPLSSWEDNREKLSAGLNIHVIAIEQGDSNRNIKMTVISADHQIPKQILWRDECLSTEDFEIVLGESVLGKVKLNLNVIPHILIGGSTGSGKTILLRSVLLQCVMKKATVIVADFKGVDFHRVWRNHCEIITDADLFVRKLDAVIEELNNRKETFMNQDCADIREYNAAGDRFDHIIVACDEISELLDKTGADKGTKTQIAKIEGALATIARQGRAFGIHLILATQRPDANILPGQIKNNMDCRICGRADNVLSQIILDNTDAADAIAKNATGRFLMNDGTIFQGYYVNDDMVSAIN